jgi:hypothetical protein
MRAWSTPHAGLERHADLWSTQPSAPLPSEATRPPAARDGRGRQTDGVAPRYLTILKIRSMPRRVCTRPSWVSMKHACTYQPGLALMISC